MSWVDRLLGRTSARASVAATLPQLPGGAPVGDVMPRTLAVQRADPFAVEANAGPNLISALRAADNGYLSALNAAIDSALVRDARLAGVARARVLAITSRRWAVRPPVGYEQDRQALAIAQAVTQVLYQTPGFAQRRGELADGILRPVAILEHDWQIDRNGWRVSRPRRIDPALIDYDIRQGCWVVAEGSLRGTPLREWQDKFVIHSPSGGLALPAYRRGALRPMLSLSLAKRYGLRWWAEMLERFGQPQVYGIVEGTNANATLLNELTEGLRNLSSQWSAAFKGGTKIEALPVSINDEAHKKFIDFVNTEYAVNLLGGNLSTESKDGQVYGSQAQAQVRSDLLAADLVELDETIVDQWIEPTVRFNAPGAPIPVLESVVSQTRPMTIAEYQAGLCTLNEYRVSNGQDPIDGGDTFAQPQLPSYAQGSPLAMPAPLALPSGGADAGSPFPRSTPQSSPTSPTPRSGLVRSLSQS